MEKSEKKIPTAAKTGEKIPVLLITGPTASGKSELAIRLALSFNAEIVSADSMQIYRGADIATAKVRGKDQKGIPHHLLNIKNPDEGYSVAEFCLDATRTIEKIHARGKLAILCGGSSQYLGAMLDGLNYSSPERNEETSSYWNDLIERDGEDFWHSVVLKLDPESAARIHARNRKRLIRFFELYQKTLRTQSEIYEASRREPSPFFFLPFVLMPEREALYERINQRARNMFREGILAELSALLAEWPQFETTQLFQAIGYKEILPCLRAGEAIGSAVERLAMNSRRYAKRQRSYFRSRIDLIPLESMELERNVEQISQELSKYLKRR